MCGAASIVCAAHGRVDVSLLLLLLGAVFDSLDGAAARRFGGTRFGVLADDVADAVSYAVAPGVAIAHVVDGVAGTVVGVVFVALTVTRLVYFTLRKGQPGDDPRHFRGMPSTVGGVVALAAAILFPVQPALVAFVAGMAVVLMVSFDAGFLHLGRAVGALPPPTRRRIAGVVVVGVTCVALALGRRRWPRSRLRADVRVRAPRAGVRRRRCCARTPRRRRPACGGRGGSDAVVGGQAIVGA